MSVILGTTYSDLYAAVGAHSGLAYGAAHDLSTALAAMRYGALAPAPWGTRAAGATGLPVRVVPTIVFHGDRDLAVNVVNADHVLAQWVDAPAGGDATAGADQW